MRQASAQFLDRLLRHLHERLGWGHGRYITQAVHDRQVYLITRIDPRVEPAGMG
jgi:hypothetical protein